MICGLVVSRQGPIDSVHDHIAQNEVVNKHEQLRFRDVPSVSCCHTTDYGGCCYCYRCVAVNYRAIHSIHVCSSALASNVEHRLYCARFS